MSTETKSNEEIDVTIKTEVINVIVETEVVKSITGISISEPKEEKSNEKLDVVVEKNLDTSSTNIPVTKTKPVSFDKKNKVKPLNHEKFRNNGSSCCIYSCVFLAFALIIAFIIIEYVYATKYKDSSCNSFMHPSTWLYVSTSVAISSIIILPCAKYIDKYKYDDISFIYSLFGFIWLIIGSVIYWRDCSSIEPKTFNDFIYAILLISWICYGLNFIIGCCKLISKMG